MERVSDVSFKDALVLVRFYDEYKNTNEFIDEAEQRAHDNVGLYLYASQNYRDLFADFSLLICPYGMR